MAVNVVNWEYTDGDDDRLLFRRDGDRFTVFTTSTSGLVYLPDEAVPELIAFLTDDVGTPIERAAPEDGAEVKYWVSGTDFDDGPYHTRSLAVIARDRSDDPGSKRIVRGTIRYEDVT